MSSLECGVMSSRGWNGGLTLSMPESGCGKVLNPDRNIDIVTSENTASSSDSNNVVSSNNSSSIIATADSLEVLGSSSGGGSHDRDTIAMTTSSVSSQGGGVTVASRRGRASPAPLNRVPLVKQSEERRARRCRFYRNGDR